MNRFEKWWEGVEHNLIAAGRDNPHVLAALKAVANGAWAACEQEVGPRWQSIEKTVLQSEQVQEWKRDAERYRWLKKQFRIMSLDMGGNHTWILQRPLREGCSIDAVCDTSMEKQQ